MEELRILEQCLGDALDAAAGRWGERTGWVFEDTRVSFADMAACSAAVARALMAAGIGKGDLVATWMPSLREFAEIEFACARIGAIVVPINTRFRSFEVSHMLSETEARVLVMTERFLKNDYVAILAEIGALETASGGRVSSPRFPALELIVSVDGECDRRLLNWQDFLASGGKVPPEELAERQAGLHWSEPMLLQYTSGSTSAPKGALLNHRYVLNVGQAKFTRMAVGEGDAVLSTQPIYHIGGSCAAVPTPVALGCTMVIPKYYEAERVMQLIERERCVARTGMPAMYIMEMNHPNFGTYDLSSIRTASCTGTVEMREKIRDRMGIPYVMSAFSSTEAGGTHGHWREPWELRANTCGRPYAGTEIEIRDPETGEVMPAGEAGEIFIRGWWTMNGYFKQPELTRKTMDGRGFVRTGDRAFIDAEGYLHFLGRYKNMLRVGGENVSAEEVEAVLLRHPKIKQVAVIGMPDARLTEVPLAIVELVAGESADEAEIIDYCAKRMANFRVPRAVRFTQSWPLTGSGKIQRHLLLEMFGRKAEEA